MKIAVAGSTGFIGSAVVEHMRQQGHEIVRLVRPNSKKDFEEEMVYWSPSRGEIDISRLEGLDAAINVAGASVAGRWTDKKKQIVIDSRVDSTRLLAESMAKLEPRPQVLLNASAVGFYGDRGDEILTENSAAGEGFLPEVVLKWEAATQPADNAGIRVVNMRFGIVMSPEGGMLAAILPMFKRGLGGKIGSGEQFMPWVSLPELINMMSFLMDADLSGPVNLTSPNPVTNKEFTKILGRILGHREPFTVPSAAVKVAFGQMGRETALASTRAFPQRLTDAGYEFIHTDLEQALISVFAKERELVGAK